MAGQTSTIDHHPIIVSGRWIWIERPSVEARVPDPSPPDPPPVPPEPPAPQPEPSPPPPMARTRSRRNGRAAA
jgi:hypothetical protein